MRLTPTGYYSDFIVYPLLIACLNVFGLIAAGADGLIGWFAVYLGCLVLWTLIEYGLHRFVFHHAPCLKTLHRQHHEEEKALLGTPIWLSLLAHLTFVFLPVLVIWGQAMATAATAGIMLGYLWYVSVHHALHHWRMEHASYLYTLKRRHALHHHGAETCNFGVTTDFWDRLFRTSAVTPLFSQGGLQRAPEIRALESARISLDEQMREGNGRRQNSYPRAGSTSHTERILDDD